MSKPNREPINHVLDRSGWNRTPEAFMDVVRTTLAIRYPDWSIEELLCHPQQGKRFCDAVRAQTNLDITDDSILSAAFARRKVTAGLRKPSLDRSRQWGRHAQCLQQFGYEGGLSRFSALLLACLQWLEPGWSFETLTFYPNRAIRFC